MFPGRVPAAAVVAGQLHLLYEYVASGIIKWKVCVA